MNIYFIFLILILFLMMTRTKKKADVLKKDSKYVELYTNLLKRKENASFELNDYIEREKDVELLNKAKVVKVYDDLNSDLNPIDLASEIDLKAILSSGDKIDVTKIITNSDLFVWLNLALAKAYNKKNNEVIEKLFEIVSLYDEELTNVVEYNVLKANYYCVTNKIEDYTFLKDLLSGNYAGYAYDKQLIGVNKKMAASLLDFKGQELGESEIDLLKAFEQTQVGNRFMSDLEIIDKYKEEKTEE